MDRFRTTVLVPYDGSDPADEALLLACHLAGSSGTKVILLYVNVIPLALPLYGLPESMDVLGLAILKRGLDTAAMHGVSAEGLLTRGYDPAPAILRRSISLEADVIILGAHHHSSWWRSLLVPSVTERVARRAPCQVIVSYPPYGELFNAVDVVAEAERVVRSAS